jgi:hypothetical protein
MRSVIGLWSALAVLDFWTVLAQYGNELVSPGIRAVSIGIFLLIR